MSDLTPTAQIIADANSAAVTDANGRSIGVKKVDMTSQFRLARIVGAADSKNELWMMGAMVALAVRTIGEAPALAINSALDVERILGMLGDAGITAVQEWLVAEATSKAAVDLETLKN